MPHVGGQMRQFAMDVSTEAIPAMQCGDGKAVTQIVESWCPALCIEHTGRKT